VLGAIFQELGEADSPFQCHWSLWGSGNHLGGTTVEDLWGCEGVSFLCDCEHYPVPVQPVEEGGADLVHSEHLRLGQWLRPQEDLHHLLCRGYPSLQLQNVQRTLPRKLLGAHQWPHRPGEGALLEVCVGQPTLHPVRCRPDDKVQQSAHSAPSLWNWQCGLRSWEARHLAEEAQESGKQHWSWRAGQTILWGRTIAEGEVRGGREKEEARGGRRLQIRLWLLTQQLGQKAWRLQERLPRREWKHEWQARFQERCNTGDRYQAIPVHLSLRSWENSTSDPE